MCNPPVNQYSGTMRDDLFTTVMGAERKQKDQWAKLYFASPADKPGVLCMEPWELVMRIRLAIAGGANADGQISPGGVDAYTDLEALQTSLLQEGKC